MRLEEPSKGDEHRLLAFFESLSRETVLMRFLRPIRHFGPEVRRILDRSTTPVAVVTSLPDGKVIGSGEVYKITPSEGELAIVVHDAYQRRGLGSLIMYTLFLESAKKGIRKIHAYTHETNIPMKRLAKKFGGRLAGRIEEDMYDFVFDTEEALKIGEKVLAEKGIVVKTVEQAAEATAA
ncbi:hypothetical protein PYJP_13020 [Pyrofollis japonicus]|uniref:GNAT family N-acetyltransferase n=1 Tax=Pyrofollis japonicus TaxID=3060460 RepID=UPI00295A7EF6|nr:GNAT family N-acetyltransferase [Pyrofollis japonicus]BEP17950.1 hypothetical protein PYJP_13020 [Pyrofollis japonicus]